MAYNRKDVLAAIRQKYPDFNSASDGDLVDALSAEFKSPASDVLQAFSDELGLKPAPNATASFLGGLKETPRALAQFAAAGLPGMSSTFSPALTQQTVQDIVKAQGGDQDAANRLGGQQNAAAVGTSLLPIGPLVAGGSKAATTVLPSLATGILPSTVEMAGQAGAGALIRGASGAAAGALQAGAVGQPVLPAATAGATLGVGLPPIASFVASEFRPLVKPLGRLFAGKPKVVQQVAQEAIAGEGPYHPAVQRLTAAIESAKPVREAQERLMNIERGKRFGAFQAKGAETFGQAGARQQLSKLSGPLGQVDFESLKNKI